MQYGKLLCQHTQYILVSWLKLDSNGMLFVHFFKEVKESLYWECLVGYLLFTPETPYPKHKPHTVRGYHHRQSQICLWIYLRQQRQKWIPTVLLLCSHCKSTQNLNSGVYDSNRNKTDGLLDTGSSSTAALLLQIKILSSAICCEWQGLVYPRLSPDTAFSSLGPLYSADISFCEHTIPSQTNMDHRYHQTVCNNILNSISQRLHFKLTNLHETFIVLSCLCFWAEPAAHCAHEMKHATSRKNYSSQAK